LDPTLQCCGVIGIEGEFQRGLMIVGTHTDEH